MGKFADNLNLGKSVLPPARKQTTGRKHWLRTQCVCVCH